MKAQACGIAPDQPHLNIVAVKTTKRGEGELVCFWSHCGGTVPSHFSAQF